MKLIFNVKLYLINRLQCQCQCQCKRQVALHLPTFPQVGVYDPVAAPKVRDDCTEHYWLGKKQNKTGRFASE